MKIVLKVEDGFITESYCDGKPVEILILDMDNGPTDPDAMRKFNLDGFETEATAERIVPQYRPEVVESIIKQVGEE